ncbi:GNAT family N-acetyltransferase [Campylobacter sp. CCUG 57310]|uniref:GNAT family N-acetyltransferase n=1 Tax=Campylobacter sp. CCUG 57310 TaxID=2517362 RepID=UPI00156522B5|nr:GNAT family N-acetyltransferase [Campylobacter sp. CCUG 57310]QKF92035.1 acetyltransferase (GNAT family) [Campylobacter sp. CCUG 57310]
MSNFTITKATRADIKPICTLVKELAEYEKLSHIVSFKEDKFASCIFDKNYAQILVCKIENNIVGYAIYFYTFSTFLGRGGIYLEDLYVKQDYRAKGIGRAFLARLAQICKEENLSRLEWACLNWNEPSIKFYENLGAINLSKEWRTYRLDGENLANLADDKR